MKIKTKWFGTITGSEKELLRFKEILFDAATYNLEKGYIKVHGDLYVYSIICKGVRKNEKR